jgi:hypothetical protein
LYYPDKTSEWWKVEFNYRRGYIHNSRIMSFYAVKEQINNFYQDFYKNDRNNAEMGEVNNEKLFLFTLNYPSASLTAFCEQRKEIQNFLLNEYESPIADTLDLQLIYSRLLSIESSCLENYKILDAIKKAGQKSGMKLKPFKTFASVPDYNNPQKQPSITNRWFTDKINGKPITYYLNHPAIDIYSKMFYQGQFIVSDDTLTFSFLDSVLTENNETKYFYIFLCLIVY